MGKDVSDTGCMLAQHVGVDAQGHGWVGEDQAAVVVPGRPSGEAFYRLLAMVLAQDGDGFAVDADGAEPAALSGAFDALAAYDGS